MTFVLYCVDKAEHGHVRAENRPAHLDYLNSNLDRIVIAGPMTSDDGKTVKGSVIVVNDAERAAAEAFAENDPYAKAGLFESVTITAYKKVLP
ncbi:YciI family protein [Pelagibius litoralis]|uniref:YciI family protein n=1 Tax=Pelagibius litoralis TaxID=374515 RepID=A0A967F0S3_9PROT|nr:YciI family protein [Pelagibius litoralis]NIA71043.1 YciI family protein [Pelagibius litoralis]